MMAGQISAINTTILFDSKFPTVNSPAMSTDTSNLGSPVKALPTEPTTPDIASLFSEIRERYKDLQVIVSYVSHVDLEASKRNLESELDTIQHQFEQLDLEITPRDTNVAFLDTLSGWDKVVPKQTTATTSPEETCLITNLRTARTNGSKLSCATSLTKSLPSAMRRFYKCRSFDNLRDTLDDNLSRHKIPKVLFTAPDLSECTEYWRPERLVMRNEKCKLDPIQQCWADYFKIRDSILLGIEDAVEDGRGYVESVEFLKTSGMGEGWIERINGLMDDVDRLHVLEKLILETESDDSMWRNPFTGYKEQAGSADWPVGWTAVGKNKYILGIERLMTRYSLLSFIVGDPGLDRWMLGEDFDVFMSKEELMGFTEDCNARQGYYCPNLRLP